MRDLHETVARLEKLGAKVRIPVFDEAGNRLTFLSDPDGIWIELYEHLEPEGAPTSQAVD